MISLYGLAAFCIAIFAFSAAGVLFSGNMLRKLMFSSLMFLAASVMLVCLPPQERPQHYYLSIMLVVLGELGSSLAIVFETVHSLRTLDSGAVRGGD